MKHNNNANPTTYPLDITFKKLGNILRPGRYKGELDLDYDPNNKMTEAIARGVTFYNDKKKHFSKHRQRKLSRSMFWVREE